jgi:hypothetical protein
LREDGVQVLARLNRAYIFRNDPTQGGQKLVRYSIRANTGWPNYYPLEIVLELGEGQQRRSRFKMSYLWLNEARTSLEQTWRQLPTHTPFFAKMKALTRTYRRICKRKAQEARAEEGELRRQLESSTASLQDPSNDLDVQCHHRQIQQQLQNLEARKVKGKHIRSHIRWKAKGDLATAEFFRAVQ